MDTVFDLRNISYSYVGKINALKDISLKVGHGEQISIIGSNGSGKSTLLAILNGLIYPISGEFYIFYNYLFLNRKIYKRPAVQRLSSILGTGRWITWESISSSSTVSSSIKPCANGPAWQCLDSGTPCISFVSCYQLCPIT
jgi:energy-coupling factor transporter ATP-binding protein EcfA2